MVTRLADAGHESIFFMISRRPDLWIDVSGAKVFEEADFEVRFELLPNFAEIVKYILLE